MALELIVDTVPEELKAYYVSTEGGKFKLDVKGVVTQSDLDAEKTKVKDFRDNNIKLTKDLEKFKSFADVLGSENLNAEGLAKKVDDLVAAKLDSRVGEMKKTYDEQIKTLTDDKTKISSKVSELVLDNEVTKVATEHGVLGTAIEDVMVRAKTMFNVVDGEVKPRDDKGDANGKPYTIDSWVKDLKGKAEHLFGKSQGTFAGRNGIVLGNGINTTSGSKRSGIDMIAAGLRQNEGAAKKLHSK